MRGDGAAREVSLICEGKGGEGRWLLVYDHCMGNAYAAALSTDLRHWEVAGEAEFPANTRHASIVDANAVRKAVISSALRIS